MIRLAFAFLLSLCVSAHAQLSGGVGGFPGPGTAHASGAAYSGPGDAVSGATTWGSCARAYNAAYANGTNPLCDLVDNAAPTTVICTLRVLTSGFVDLTGTYCTGGVTPAVKCAAATGGVCNISQVYDQTGGGLHWTQATAANQPKLSFSALNSLPGISCASASAQRLDTAQTLTPPSSSGPMTFSTVAKRTSNFTTKQSVIGAQPGQSIGIGFAASASTATLNYNVTSITQGSVTDSSFHAVQGVVSGASSVLDADGSSTTSTLSGSAPGANQGFRICRDQGGNLPLDGIVMEVGVWMSTAFSAGNITSVNSNQHGANGYNF